MYTYIEKKILVCRQNSIKICEGRFFLTDSQKRGVSMLNVVFFSTIIVLNIRYVYTLTHSKLKKYIWRLHPLCACKHLTKKKTHHKKYHSLH